MVCSNVSDRGGRRCPASRDDAAGQIWGLYRSGKQTKPDPALRPSSRYKSTKNHSKPVAPCPLESSTVHDDALNKAESFCVTKAATLGSTLSIPQSVKDKSNQATNGLPDRSHKIKAANISRELWRSRTVPEKIMTEGSGMCASNRRVRPPHTSTKNKVARGKTLISLMDFSVSPSCSSPLSLLSWPISKPFGPAHLIAKIRFASNFLQNSAPSMARFSNMNGRGLHFCLDSTSIQWFCDMPFPVKPSTAHDASATSLFSASEPSGSVPTPFTLPPATTASSPIINSSPYCRHAATFICPSKVNLGFPLVGISFHFGPLSKSRPITKRTGPFSVNDWPRYVLLSPSQLQLNFSDLSGRRHHLRRKTITLQWSCVYHPSILAQIPSMAKLVEIKILQEASSAEEDWKKPQVDSKKIFAQPHQSATRIIGDILSIAKSFHDLSFRFIPRSDNMFDDLARTADQKKKAAAAKEKQIEAQHQVEATPCPPAGKRVTYNPFGSLSRTKALALAAYSKQCPDFKNVKKWPDLKKEPEKVLTSYWYWVLRTPKKWLYDTHMDAGINMLRKRHYDHPEWFRSERICFLDTMFSSYWRHKYGDYKTHGVLPPNAYDLRLGEQPKFCQTFKFWGRDIDDIYSTLHVKGNHWVGMWISINDRHITLWDCAPKHAKEAEIEEAVAPICEIMGSVLHQVMYKDQQECYPDKKFTATRLSGGEVPQNHQSSDCGVYCLKYIECHALGIRFPRDELYDAKMKHIRTKLAAEVYDEMKVTGLEPRDYEGWDMYEEK